MSAMADMIGKSTEADMYFNCNPMLPRCADAGAIHVRRRLAAQIRAERRQGESIEAAAGPGFHMKDHRL